MARRSLAWSALVIVGVSLIACNDAPKAGRTPTIDSRGYGNQQVVQTQLASIGSLPPPSEGTPPPAEQPEERLYRSDTGLDPTIETIRPYAVLLDVLTLRCREGSRLLAIDAENVLKVLHREYGKDALLLDALTALEVESRKYESRGFGYCPTIQLMHEAAKFLSTS